MNYNNKKVNIAENKFPQHEKFKTENIDNIYRSSVFQVEA